MAFSFNWAGLNVPSVNYVNSMDPEFGKNLGIAARGLKNRMAASDFAKKIDAYEKYRGYALQLLNNVEEHPELPGSISEIENFAVRHPGTPSPLLDAIE